MRWGNVRLRRLQAGRTERERRVGDRVHKLAAATTAGRAGAAAVSGSSSAVKGNGHRRAARRGYYNSGSPERLPAQRGPNPDYPRFDPDPAEADGYAYDPRNPVGKSLGHHTGVGTGELRRLLPEHRGPSHRPTHRWRSDRGHTDCLRVDETAMAAGHYDGRTVVEPKGRAGCVTLISDTGSGYRYRIWQRGVRRVVETSVDSATADGLTLTRRDCLVSAWHAV